MNPKKKKKKPAKAPRKQAPKSASSVTVYTPPAEDPFKRQRERTERNKRRVLECLKECFGIVTSACLMADVGRTQFYEWLKTDTEFEAEVKDVGEIAIDFVEGQLLKSIRNQSLPGSTTATIFYLKCKAKKRGYVDRIETVVINPDKDLEDMTDTELAEEEEKLEGKKESPSVQ